MKVSSNQYNVKFNALPLSSWKCIADNNLKKEVIIATLEKRDIDCIEKIFKNFSFSLDYNFDVTRKAIISSAVKTIKTLFLHIDKIEDFNKIKMLLALDEGNPCGILIGNIPKILLSDNDIYVYSSRHNSAKKETEIDWFVTWQQSKDYKLKGVGKSLIGEYFSTLKKDGFRDVFVRSEIPEYSYASNFYESLGFERLTNKNVKLSNRNTNKYVVENYAEKDDLGIPMIITRGKINNKLSELISIQERKEIKKESVDLNEFRNLLAKKS